MKPVGFVFFTIGSFMSSSIKKLHVLSNERIQVEIKALRIATIIS